MKIKIIKSFIAGIIIALFAIHAYTVYSLQRAVVEHESVLRQVVSYLNAQSQAMQSQKVAEPVTNPVPTKK